MLEKTDSYYRNWILDLKTKIQQSQIKAAIKVNNGVIELNWDLGKEISERTIENSYCSGFFNQLSKNLREEYPQIKKIMDILQDQKINSFSLVTGLRAKPKTTK